MESVRPVCSRLVAALLSLPILATAQPPTYPALVRQMQELATQHRNVAQIATIGKTAANREVVALQITRSPNPAQTPAIALVAGVDARLHSAPQLALAIAQNLASGATTDSVAAWLQRTVVYVIPVASPDAYARAVASPVLETTENARTVDNDHDALRDEDPGEDLNGDGLITLMRVADAAGQWLPHPDEPRIMAPANPALGQRGSHRVWLEGADTDHDQLWNEDGAGGVAFNHNWSHEYPAFNDVAGPNPVSEPECRAVADYLYDRPNIQVVLVLGPHNNLHKPWQHDPAAAHSRLPATPHPADNAAFAWAGKLYGNQGFAPYSACLEDSLGERGAFLPWAYYHYGRLAVANPGWWWPLKPFVPDTLQTDSANKALKAKLENDDARVKWLASVPPQVADSALVPWTGIQHPDFPNQIVEVGGWRPYHPHIIPTDSMAIAVERNRNLVWGLGNSLARIRLENLRVANRGAGVYAIEADVVNVGQLPTLLGIAAENRFVKLVVARATLTENQRLVGGKLVHKLKALQPGQSQHLTWVVAGEGKLTLSVGALHTGFVVREVNLN